MNKKLIRFTSDNCEEAFAAISSSQYELLKWLDEKGMLISCLYEEIKPEILY